MKRVDIINRIGICYLTKNIERDEYSYAKEAGSVKMLTKVLGYKPEHYKLDIRFENDRKVVVLVETKTEDNVGVDQLKDYLNEEKALHPNNKIICILINLNDGAINVWKSSIDDNHLLVDEQAINTMDYYESLFEENIRQNNREKVLQNTFHLNETLHTLDIPEKLRSQLVGTTLLYLRDIIKQNGITEITDNTNTLLINQWRTLSPALIRTSIEETLTKLLDGSSNKQQKIELLQKNILNNQKVKKLQTEDWISIFQETLNNIYKYINTDSSEGQDILNLFFVAFNKYTGKADKNQAFTPDHITHFMCLATDVDRNKRILDGTCGSGAFLVQAMVLKLADVNKQPITNEEKVRLRNSIVKEHIYGIENEENAYGLATTNMLIHGDGNSNIELANLFSSEDFIQRADPDIILMNPPYNAKPISILSTRYKKGWKKDAKSDPTKGLVFLKYLSDIILKMNKKRCQNHLSIKEVKVAILLPVAVAIGGNKHISKLKKELLKDNTLEAVFTLPNEIFYPGASVNACCMIFTLGKPHKRSDGTIPETFFGYYKDDGHKKKKNLGRVELFNDNNQSLWKQIENEWLSLFRNKRVVEGKSAMRAVTEKDEWLCEAYMKTEYNTLSEKCFQQTINDYCGYLVKSANFPNLIFKQSSAIELNLNTWKEFKVKEILECKTTKWSVKDDLSEGIVPFVSRSAENNGCDGYVEVTDDRITLGNCITIGAEGIYSFYQPVDFATGNKVYQLRNKNLNKYSALFLITILNCEAYRYSYGRARILNKLKEETLLLPVSDDGKPDWIFMENYIKSLSYGDCI